MSQVKEGWGWVLLPLAMAMMEPAPGVSLLLQAVGLRESVSESSLTTESTYLSECGEAPAVLELSAMPAKPSHKRGYSPSSSEGRGSKRQRSPDLCEHGRTRYYCGPCGGGGICQHGRRKSRCKPCGGGGICQHNRVRYVCKICGGGGICEHNRVRNQCKDCGGSSICEHARQRHQCTICNSATAQQSSCPLPAAARAADGAPATAPA